MTRPEVELLPTVLEPAIAPRQLAHLHGNESDCLLSVDGAGGGDNRTSIQRGRRWPFSARPGATSGTEPDG